MQEARIIGANVCGVAEVQMVFIREKGEGREEANRSRR